MNVPESPARKTPSEMLAKEIAERLLAAGLIQSSKRERVERGLATGALPAVDWGLLVETAEVEGRRG